MSLGRIGGHGLVVAAVLLAGALTARASTTPEVSWKAPLGCPSEAEVQAMVVRQLAGAPPGGKPDVEAALKVTAVLDGLWRVEAHLRGPGLDERRTLDADRCETLAELVALEVAIAVQPALAGRDAGPGTPRLVAMPQAPAVRKHWALFSLASGVAMGVLLTPTALLRAAGGVRGRRWSVSLTQTFWLPRDIPSPLDPAVGGRMWLWAAGVKGCVIPLSRRFEVKACAAFEAGVVSGRGIGALVVSERPRSAWVALSAGPGFAVWVHEQVALTVDGDFLYTLVRPRFEISGKGEVCCTDSLGARVVGGIEVRLP